VILTIFAAILPRIFRFFGSRKIYSSRYKQCHRWLPNIFRWRIDWTPCNRRQLLWRTPVLDRWTTHRSESQYYVHLEGDVTTTRPAQLQYGVANDLHQLACRTARFR